MSPSEVRLGVDAGVSETTTTTIGPSGYSKTAQWSIVVIVALAGLFRYGQCSALLMSIDADTSRSPLPANIYFPAIPSIAAAFHESTEAINLTVTVYLVFQGICMLTSRLR